MVWVKIKQMVEEYPAMRIGGRYFVRPHVADSLIQSGKAVKWDGNKRDATSVARTNERTGKRTRNDSGSEDPQPD